MKLRNAGFQQLHYHLPFSDDGGIGDGDSTVNPKLVPGGKYYYHVHQSALVAFVVGRQASATNPIGFHMIGGHTDSPNLKLKPNSKKPASGNGTCRTLGVQTYGGGLWHTWLDRDLSISGKVLVKKKVDVNSSMTKVEPKLVKLA